MPCSATHTRIGQIRECHPASYQELLKLAEPPSQCQQKASGNCDSAHVQGKEELTSKSNTGTFYTERKL